MVELVKASTERDGRRVTVIVEGHPSDLNALLSKDGSTEAAVKCAAEAGDVALYEVESLLGVYDEAHW